MERGTFYPDGAGIGINHHLLLCFGVEYALTLVFQRGYFT
jgi:hypothetical protein